MSKLLNFISVLPPIVLTLFFILIRYNVNLDELIINDLIYVCTIFIPIIIILVFVIKLLTKNTSKYILIFSFIIILFFIYIPLHDELYQFQIFSFELGKHVILFPIVIISSIILIYKIIKSKINFKKFLTVLFGVAVILIIFNISEIIIYSNPTSILSNEEIKSFSIDKENFRDVYYLLLDEHAGTNTLKKYFDYDNSKFDHSLKEMGFFIPEKSLSNYTPTRMAIPSILNMDYIQWDHSLNHKEQEMNLQKIAIQNQVTKTFKHNGYKTLHFYNEFNIKSSSNPEDELCNNSIGGRTFASFMLDNTPLIIIKNIIDVGNFKQFAENRLCILESIPHLDEDYSEPLFVFGHIMLPHRPFLFESDGTRISHNEYVTKKMFDESAYISQLQYTDSKILEIVKILLDKEPQPIIVLLSDHGYRVSVSKDNYNSMELSYSNFAAYYFPDKEFTNNKDILTPVNSFRMLFNDNFGTNYKLLENKIFLTPGDDISPPEDITSYLIKE